MRVLLSGNGSMYSLLLSAAFSASLAIPTTSTAGPKIQGPEGSVKITNSTCAVKDCLGAAAPINYDVNRDCKLDQEDASLVREHVHQNLPYNSKYDIDGNNFVTGLDALLIINKLNCAPPVQECRVYQINWRTEELFSLDNDPTAGGGAFSGGIADADIITVDPASFSCFHNAAQEAFTWAQAEMVERFGKNWKTLENAKYYDDLVVTRLEQSKFVNYEATECSKRLSTLHYEGECATGTVFVDKDCNLLDTDESEIAKQCIASVATINAKASSPISLVWDERARIGDKVSVVQFPLNPAEMGSTWIWKASGELPLLVYDPEHTGRITSATQLFGNWTFGGQRTAAAALSVQGSLARPWRDGYEALGTLDENEDGMISGSELSPLGLWFDTNRDGVSQAGEVKDVSSAGVYELYFRNPITNPVTKDVQLPVGFKRRDAQGREISGGSVDWYSDRSHNPGEIFLRHTANPSLNGGALAPSDLPVNLALPATDGAAASKAASDTTPKTPAYSGLWSWAFNETDLQGGKRVGLLLIHQLADGTLKGRSVLEAPVSGIESVKSMIYAALLSGRVNADKSASFSVPSERGVVSTTAHLSSDGRSMTGESTFISVTNKKEVLYRWSARKQS